MLGNKNLCSLKLNINSSGLLLSSNNSSHMIIVFVLLYWHELFWDHWDTIQLARFLWFHTYCSGDDSSFKRNISLNSIYQIFQGVTINQNSSSVPWWPSWFTKLTAGTLDISSLSIVTIQILRIFLSLYFPTHFLPKQGSSSNFYTDYPWTRSVYNFLHIYAFKNH